MCSQKENGFCRTCRTRRTCRTCRTCGTWLNAEYLLEHRHRSFHVFHAAERDARVGLLHRREVASHGDALGRAPVTELHRGPADVDEDEVGLRLGRLEA